MIDAVEAARLAKERAHERREELRERLVDAIELAVGRAINRGHFSAYVEVYDYRKVPAEERDEHMALIGELQRKYEAMGYDVHYEYYNSMLWIGWVLADPKPTGDVLSELRDAS